MDPIRSFADEVAGRLPKVLRTWRQPLLAIVWLGSTMLAATAADLDPASKSDENPPSSAALSELKQPIWNLPQSAASQVDRPLEVPGLQQPGFLAPAGEKKHSLTTQKRNSASAERAKDRTPAIIPGEGTAPAQEALPSQPAVGPSLWQQLRGTSVSQASESATENSPQRLAYPGQQATQLIPTHDSVSRFENLATQLLPTTTTANAPTSGAATSRSARAELAYAESAVQAPETSGANTASHPARAESSSGPPGNSKPAWMTGLVQQLAPTSASSATTKSVAIAPKSAAPASGETHGRGAREAEASQNNGLPPGSIPPPNAGAIAERTIGTLEQGGSLSALWRPLTMTQDGAPTTTVNVPTPSPSRASAPASTSQPLGSGPTLEETLQSSIFLRPFYLTDATRNDENENSRAHSMTLGESRTLEERLRSSTLMRQLALSTGDDLAAPVDSLAEEPLRSEEAAWQEGWTAHSPSLAYPFTSTNSPSATGGSSEQDAQLVAFMQEALPAPSETNSSGAAPSDTEGSQSAASTGSTTDGKKDSLAGAERLGEEPPDNSLQFLRTATVLLKPGDSQFDIGLTYLFSENQFPILLADDVGNVVGVDEVDFRVRELAMPFEYRVGLLKRVQGFIGASVGWSNTELSLDNFEAFENDGGFGDVNFGLTAQILDATANCPYTIVTVQATAPTGGDPFDVTAAIAPSAPSLGQGFWSIAANLLLIQPYDPVVLFYGIGTEQFFSEEYRGIEFEPGAQYNYTFGVGFAMNERVTLSSRFFGAYVEELKADGVRLFNTNLEPMSLRFAATISKPCNRIVEPFVEFGLTNQSVSSFFGCTWTF